MTCPLCGAPTAEDAVRCPQCGSVLPGAGPEPDALPVYGAPSEQAGAEGPDVAISAASGRGGRRPVVIAVGAGLALVVVALAGTMARGGRGGGGIEIFETRERRELPAAVEGEPDEAWRTRFAASAVLGLGGVVVGAEERSGDLVGFGASDGDERWRIEPVESGERIVWLAPLGDDAVLVQYRPRDDEDTVARLAAVSTDGDVRWRYFRPEMGFATPVGEDGDVAVLSSERSGRGAFDLTLLARSDGDVRWSTSGYLMGFGGETVYLVRDDRLVALDLANGDERWNRSVDRSRRVGGGGVEVGDTFVTTRSGTRVVGLSVVDGRFLWSRSFADQVFAGRRGGDVALVLGQEEASGLDPEDGTVRWTVDSDDWATFGTLIRVDGQDGVYALGDSITRYDTETGERMARVRMQNGPVSDILTWTGLADGRFYVAEDEELRGIDAASLEVRWSVDVGFDSFDIAAADDTVVVAGDDELIGYR